MRRRTNQSTNPSTAAPADLPAPTGPTDDRFVYHLEPKALKVLAEHGDGEPLARPAARVAEITDALEAETRRQRRRDARRRSRRLATISHCTRGSQRLPLLRLSGHWLREAGFALGREYEVEVGKGKLIIEAV
jgi:hypothetical protein